MDGPDACVAPTTDPSNIADANADFDGELPEGWTNVQTRDLFEYVTSGSRGWARHYADTGALFLRVTNLDHNSINVNLRDLCHVRPPRSAEGTRTRVQVGDILVSITADVGMIGLVERDLGEAYVNQHVALCRPRDSCDRRFLAWYLASAAGGQAQFQELRRGVTKAGLGLEDVLSVSVPLPPLAEQKRIVAKVDEVLAHVNAARDHLARVPALLKRFRQSVLAAACSGRLTEDWRRASRVTDDEDLPHGWKSVRLADILEPGGLFDGPFGSNLKTSDYTDTGVRVVRLENLANLCFIEEKRTFISKKKYESLKRHTLFEDDILFGSFVDDAVRVCRLPTLDTPAIAKADCFCLRARRQLVDHRYLVLQLGTSRTRDALVEEIHGATRPRITTKQLRELEILLCPMPEQHEIIRRVDALFALADSIEQRVADATARANALTQATLAKAFRGELVPTEAEMQRQRGDY